jgi:hypothetical protein
MSSLATVTNCNETKITAEPSKKKALLNVNYHFVKKGSVLRKILQQFFFCDPCIVLAFADI